MKAVVFSIVIPFYNKAPMLERCLASVLNQSYPADGYEIICVNNNSTDDYVSILQRYPSVHLLEEKRQGAYAARNAGTLKSIGSFIVFTDADVEVPENWLANINAALTSGGYDLLIGHCLPALPSKVIDLYNISIIQKNKKALKYKRPSLITACTANLIVRKDVFNKQGLFKTDSNSEDSLFTMRCLDKGYHIGLCEDIAVKRNDIPSVKALLLKNFIYGLSNALSNQRPRPNIVNLDYFLILIRLIPRSFPAGFGLLLIAVPYCLGAFLAKIGILNKKITSHVIAGYVKLTTAQERKAPSGCIPPHRGSS